MRTGRIGNALRSGMAIALASLAAGACGGSSSEAEAGAPSVAATSAPAVSTTPADPLEGEWHAEVSCQDILDAVERAGTKPAVVDEWAAGIRGYWGGSGEPSPKALCGGAEEPIRFIWRFQGGALVGYDPPTNQEATPLFSYEIVDEDSFTASDGGTGNFSGSGTITFEYAIVGDQIRFDLVGEGSEDPWVVAGWESGPFTRSS
jgi:hypothetical protein